MLVAALKYTALGDLKPTLSPKQYTSQMHEVYACRCFPTTADDKRLLISS